MQSDAELFGLGKKKKPTLDGLDAPDPAFAPIEPAEDTAAKIPPSYNGNELSTTAGVSQPQVQPDKQTLDVPATADTPKSPTTNAALDTDGYATPAVITQRTTAAPPGFDQAKWANANNQHPKYAVGGIVADAIAKGARDLTPELVSQINAAYPGTQQVNGTTVNIPGVGEVQVINDGQVRWDTAGSFGPPAEAAIGGGDLASVIAGQGSDLGRSGGNMATTVSGGGNQSLEEILASDPAIAAYRRSAARDFGRQRATLAEQSAQNGTFGSGGEDGRIRQLKENEAEAVAGYTGDRASAAQQVRIQQDQFAKSLGFNYDQLSQQQKQFLANLGQNRDQFLASLGLSERQLSAQQKRDLDNLTFAYDQFEAQQNNIAADRALGR